MTKTRLRKLIPAEWADLDLWPRPLVAALNLDDQGVFARRETAIRLYRQYATWQNILERTQLARSEVRRLIRRCLKKRGLTIVGFFGIVPRLRIAGYKRKKPVVHHRGGSRGGCAGAFSDLLARFPAIADQLFDDLFDMPRPGVLRGMRLPFDEIWGLAKTRLQEEFNLQDHDYPFCTKDRGYESARQYFHDLGAKNPHLWARARSGRNARRRAPVGSGHEPLIVARRPYTFSQC